MKWNSQSIIPMAVVSIENKKNLAASPSKEEEPYDRFALYHKVQKKLHPERTEEQRKEQIDSLKGLLDISNKKDKESVLPIYPAQVDEYGPTLNYD